MSVRGHTTDAKHGSPAFRSATYMACEECGEGAIVWDPELGASKCHSCGADYRGRP